MTDNPVTYRIHKDRGDGQCPTCEEPWPCAFVSGVRDFASIEVTENRD